MLRVVDVDYIKDYELLVTFSDGNKKKVDLRPYLTGEVFGELLDKEKFVQYGLTRITIEWANGADLAPEFLLLLSDKSCKLQKGIVRPLILRWSNLFF